MLDNYELLDRYRRESGRVLLTGTQALVRIPLMPVSYTHLRAHETLISIAYAVFCL